MTEKGRQGTIEDKVHSVVRRMGEDVAYMFANWAQANVSLDDVTKPTILYILPPSGTLDINWSRIKDAPAAQIAFLCPTDFDFEGHVNDNIVERMKRLCYRFLKALNDSGLFEPIEGKLTYQVPYDVLDRNLTGIVITPPLEEVDGVVFCDGDWQAVSYDDGDDVWDGHGTDSCGGCE